MSHIPSTPGLGLAAGSSLPLMLDPSGFARQFNQHSFPVQHRLHETELFTLPRLIELARSTTQSRPGDLYYDAGTVDPGQRWNQTPRANLPADETIRRIRDAGAWIILKQAQHDPDYAALLNRCIGELLELTGKELEQQIQSQEVIVFITSPRRVTAYHIDTECNFLLQVHGEKQIHIFDRDDRDVLPETELERFWAVDTNAAIYKPALQERASTTLLRPGDGVHIPVNCPHWLQNGDDVSISVSINFRYRDGLRGDLYRANYYLRKLGLHPKPPFQSPARDGAKRMLGALARRSRKLRYGRAVD